MDSNWPSADWLQAAIANTAIPATITLVIIWVRQDWKPEVKAGFTEFEELEMAMNASSGEIVSIQNTMDEEFLPVHYTDVYF